MFVGVFSLSYGEYLERLIARRLSERLGVPTNVEEEEVWRHRLTLTDETRATREEERAIPSAFLIERHILDQDLEPTLVERVGDARSATGIPADLRIEFASGDEAMIQVKSVGSGTGTARNLGMTVVERLTGLELDEFRARALAATLEVARIQKVSIEAQSFGALHRATKQLPDEQQTMFLLLAKEAYAPFKLELTNALVRSFNEMDAETQVDFVCDILGWERIGGANPRTSRLTLLCTDAGERLVSSAAIEDKIRQGGLVAERYDDRGNSLVIRNAEYRLLRMNSTATNAQGISNPAVRVFFLDDAVDLFIDVVETS